MSTRFHSSLGILLLVAGCGDGGGDPAAPPPDPAFHECAGDGDCDDGRVCVAAVCLPAPARAATLGGEEKDEQGRDVGIDSEEPPVTGCWGTSDPVADLPAQVRLQGRVEPLASGGSVQGLCLSVYDQEALLRHWREESRCPEVGDPDKRAECFATDACTCAGKVGPEQETCEADAGPALAWGLVKESRGDYAIDGIPTNRPLVVKVSGGGGLWKPTYTWGEVARTDRLESDDQGTRFFWVSAQVVSNTDWLVFPPLLGLTEPLPADTGAVAGELLDCGVADRPPQPIIGATMGLVADPVVLGYHVGDPESDAFEPESTRPHTANLGIYVALAVPEGPNRLAAAALVTGEVRTVASLDLYVPPSSGLVVNVYGHSAWREEP